MSDKLPAPVLMRFASAGAALITGVISAVHVYWAAGGRAGLTAALPQTTAGKPVFLPSPAATLVVAAGLAGMSGAALFSQSQSAARLRWPLRVIVGVFLIRAVGDGRSVGLTRKPSDTQFARMDARFYTPLCLLLAALYGVLGFSQAKQAD
ncbi:DUF3995 domain-containing protein [Deinococcus sp. Arct2-2]|uniref:DUF3995 domain-containing protein n=1 Tax=Deinococcus sp. Arct2-2 TaxID=2568653 RepID=UPI001F0EF32C|nr:DUF3995 domain-containing protein [Deinococcus sp. Arct2-2]